MGASGGYAQASGGYTLTITEKPITVTGLTAVNRDYDNTTDVALSGVVPSDEAYVSAVMPTTGTVVSADAGSGKAVSFSTIALGFGMSGNYTLTQPSVTVTINRINPVLDTHYTSDVADARAYDSSAKPVAVGVTAPYTGLGIAALMYTVYRART